MTALTHSLSQGSTDVPLIEQTLGDFFDAMVARQPRPHRHLVANNAEWVLMQLATAKVGLILVNINPAYRVAEVEYALNKVGCKALVTMARFKTSDYLGMLRELAPELGRSPVPCRRMPRCARWSGSTSPARATIAGMLRFALLHGARRPTDALRLATGRHTESHGPHQHPVHQRHHRVPQGRHADAPQHPEQRLLHRRGHAPHPKTAVHSRAAVPLLWHGAGQPGLPHARRHHRVPERWLRPAVRAAGRCRTSAAPPARRAHHVHRRAGPPAFAEFNLSTCAPASWPVRPCPIEVMKPWSGDMNMREVTIAYGMTETSPVSCQSSTDTRWKSAYPPWARCSRTWR